jgi:hypothetical protein
MIKSIGNTLGKYINHVKPQDGLQDCDRLCVELNLEKGMPKVIQFNLDNWSYLQQVDYEQFTFK